MRILITGAGGIVGSHMIEKLYSEGYEVLGTYFTPTTDISEIDSNIKMIECDIRDNNRLINIINSFLPDKIFHLAAQSRPSISWDKPKETIDINVNGTINLYEIVKKIREENSSFDPVIVTACSSAAYGQTIANLPEGVLVKEHDELLPLSPYGVSKAGQDLLSFQYFENFGLKIIRARIFNTTGPKKILDITGDFTFRAVELEKNGGTTLRVGNLNTIRAILDVRDLIDALWLLSEKGRYGEAYNICNNKTIVMKDIVTIIERLMGKKFDLFVDSKLLRPADERLYAGDCTKIRKETGWIPKHSFDETVLNCLNYWRNKKDTIE